MSLPLGIVNEGGATDYFTERQYLSAFVVAILTTRVFTWLYHWKALPAITCQGLPAEMGKYVRSFLPVFITLTLFGITSSLLTMNAVVEPIETALANFVADHSTFFQHLTVALIYQTVVWFLWWLGLPGYSVMSVVQQFVYAPAQYENQYAGASHVFTNGFFEMGIPHVLALIIAMLVFSRNEKLRRIAKFGLPAMLFNVQELFLFGLPIVLNPLFLIPYVFAPLANTVVGYFAISWGIVPEVRFVVPWTMPVVLNGAISTGSVMGAILQIVFLIMDVCIYAPFVIAANMELFASKADDKGGDNT